MELKSSINETWKLFSVATFIGCFLLLLFLDSFHQNTSLSAARTAMLQLTPFYLLNSSTTIITPLEPSNVTLHSFDTSNITLNPFDTSNITLNPEELSNITLNLKVESSNVTLNPREVSNITLNPSSESPNISLNPMELTNLTVYLKDEQVLVVEEIEKAVNKSKKKCNMSEGRWVYKSEQSANYDSISCPFLEEKMSCKKNGRPDFEYEKWRWEATDCDIPVFNGTEMLKRLRNKRMIISGDSLNRNMWESLACLLYTSIPSSRVEVDAQDLVYKVLKAKDYNFTLEFHWSPFLVDFDKKHRSGKEVVVLDRVSPNSKQWRGADIMVFNSGHWWSHTGKLKSWDLFEYKGQLKEEMAIEVAYERAMKTWAKWLEKNVDPSKTTVYFRSISAEHKMRQYKQWCYNVTQPIMDESYVSVYPNSLVDIIESLIHGMSKPKVKYLNITKLSEYRIDAHPSVYRSMNWNNIIQNKFENVLSYADCSHWCLPGLPDTWNTLLYASLFYDTTS